MQKKKNGLGFIILVFALIVGALVVLFLLNKEQEKIVDASYPSYEKVEMPREVKDFDLANQPMIGKEDAPVTVVEFGDFKCPACKQWEQTVYPQLFTEYIDSGKVKFYFINFQFLGPDSRLAGNAGEIIYKQRKEAFWQFYQAIYDNQQSETLTWATHKNIVDIVKENVSGIDMVQFEKDLKEFKYFEEVKLDYSIVEKMGVTSTPSIFVNGVKLENPSYELIKASVEEELTKTVSEKEEAVQEKTGE